MEYQTTFAVVNQRSAEVVESDGFLSALQQGCRRSRTGRSLDPCASQNFFSYQLVLLAQGVRLRWFVSNQSGTYQKNSYVNDSAKELI